jgi:hypothetical protein
LTTFSADLLISDGLEERKEKRRKRWEERKQEFWKEMKFVDSSNLIDILMKDIFNQIL